VQQLYGSIFRAVKPAVRKKRHYGSPEAEFIDSKASNPLWQRFYRILWAGLTAFPSQRHRTEGEQ
jgi:hypothetical protein